MDSKCRAEFSEAQLDNSGHYLVSECIEELLWPRRLILDERTAIVLLACDNLIASEDDRGIELCVNLPVLQVELDFLFSWFSSGTDLPTWR